MINHDQTKRRRTARLSFAHLGKPERNSENDKTTGSPKTSEVRIGRPTQLSKPVARRSNTKLSK
jgi:hypothetical protein